MPHPIVQLLRPVCNRQRMARSLRFGAGGLLIGSFAATLFGISKLAFGTAMPNAVSIALLVAGPVLGWIVGLLWPAQLHAAALAVDDKFRLKDRAVSALEFLAGNSPTPIHALQMADTEQTIRALPTKDAAPILLPRWSPYAGVMALIALALLIWPSLNQTVEAAPIEPLPHIVAEAESIKKDLKELAEVAKHEENKELAKLVEKLEQMTEELMKPGVDTKEALAKLSEMQSTIQAEQAQYNTELIDAQLQALGEAMASAKSLEKAGQSLQNKKFDKAAKELAEQQDPPKDRNEARALKDRLEKVAKDMKEAGLKEFSEAVSAMASSSESSGEKSDKESKFCKACKGLGDKVCKHGSCSKCNSLLAAQLAKLCECKGNCQGCCNGGSCDAKSTNPTSKWGRGTAGDPKNGDPTSLAATRRLENLQGQIGEGDSETESIETTPEAKQLATREYKEKYQKYQKLSEAVLDAEPIPLGHRQTIRRYFQLIRPDSNDKTAPSKSP